MRRKLALLVLVLAISLAGLTACSRDSSEQAATSSVDTSQAATPGTSGQSGQAGQPGQSTQPADPKTPAVPANGQPSEGIAVGEPPPGFSPLNLPERKLTFRVSTPPNTPENAPVYLSLVDLVGGTGPHIRMKNLGDGIYEATATVQSGAMVRYTYDRFDAEGCCDAHMTREALSGLFEMQYRFLIVEDDLEVVRDNIGTWADLRAPYSEGTIDGFVTNSETGEPVLDADVSISGVHVGTRADGSFRVEGLPMGEHTVVVHSDSGDFLPVQTAVLLDDSGSESVRFSVAPAKLVPVVFVVALPNSTPLDAWVKLGGNIRRLGARIAHPARPLTPDNFFIPRVERSGNAASAEFMLPEGAFIEYFYTIGPIGVTNERAEQGRWVYRSFIVGEGGDRRSDQVKYWNNEGWPLVSLKLTPPPGTPEDAKISLNMGPSSWMERNSDGTYSTVLGTGPVGSTMSYRYMLGDDFNGADASPAVQDGFRTLTVQEGVDVVDDTVSRWLGQPDSAARREDGSLAVTFRLSVPPETPVDAKIFLNGNRPAVGSGVEMKPLATNRWIYEAEVVFGHDGPFTYRYEFRSGRTDSFTKEVNTDFDGQVVIDWVASWPGRPGPVRQRDGFVKGFYTPDFYSNNFIALSSPTYSRILDQGGSAVVVSSIWSYGQSKPIPTLEYRAVRAGSVATPLEDAIEQAQIAHDAGLDVFFGPQFNMEQAPGGFEVYNGPKTDNWWTEWLKLADEMWTWQATVAEMMGAKYMMLPGPLFHVYDHIDKPSDDPFIVNFESEQVRLISKIRGIYSGKLVVTGNTNYDFPGLADFVGVTTYDIGVPQLPSDTTVAEYVDYYEARFVKRVDPLFERWGKPVFFYTIHAPSIPTRSDPSGQIAQATALEALFQVISTRPEITAGLSWSYDMIDAPLTPGDGVRGRLAEAVLAKWYAILGGQS